MNQLTLQICENVLNSRLSSCARYGQWEGDLWLEGGSGREAIISSVQRDRFSRFASFLIPE